MHSFIKYLSYFFLFCLIGCATDEPNYRAPVKDINRAAPKMEGVYVVQEGDTFYTIAWRFNRDAQELASINHIKPPYHLYVGQKIAMSRAAGSIQPSKTVASSSSSAVKIPSVPPSKIPKVMPTSPLARNSTIPWEWPTSGKIIGHFSAQNAQKGIDIAGQNGQPVIVTAPGVVVYSGSGLRGYGKMVIVKHNDQFLSAYAHNSQILVKEGDVVKAHQIIAEMGQTDTESVRLHFEIRKNGQPVDPMLYLPKRG